MNDKELLELAAKAAGINIVWYSALPSIPEYPVLASKTGTPTSFGWNPLTDDGDALRLAVKLGIGFSFGIEDGRVVASGAYSFLGEWERIDADSYAATRRAIVRAAAEIGKQQ